MNDLLRRGVRKIRRALFPSERENAHARWLSDQGDKRLRLEYDLNADSLVVDVGGYEGQWASDIFAMYGCRVEIFEPVAAFADAIERRFRRNRAIGINRYGLGGQTRNEAISLCLDGSSIFRSAGQTESILIVDIVEWLERNRIDCVHLLKLNIEGGEYELLERLIETGHIARMVNIQVQFHDLTRDSASRMARIQHALGNTHCLTYQYKFVWENWTVRTGGSPSVQPVRAN